MLELKKPLVMGILNITPDSFYSDSRTSNENLLDTAGSMLREGAQFLDVGGYSSRPGAEEVSLEEEIRRTAPAIEAVKREFPKAIISIDTFRYEVAKVALDAGAVMINDISGGHHDARIMNLAAETHSPFIGMHMRGNPQTMQSLTDYEDLIGEISDFFAEMSRKANSVGLNDLILDPGFGFSKTLGQNYYLLKNLSFLRVHDRPILVGISRKSMIYELLETDPEDALSGTIALNAVALLKGANILRVHDVKEAVQTVKLINELNDSGF